MDRNRFNAEVRPHLTEIPIGKQGIGFDRLELDAWVDDYKSRNGRPGRSKGDKSWDANEYPASSCGPGSGISTSASSGGEFARALAQLSSKKRKRHLARVMEETRQAQVYGVRPARTFEQAAAKFVLENQHKRSHRRRRQPAQGADALDRRRSRSIGFTWACCSRGLRSGDARAWPWAPSTTACKIVRRILNLAAGEWVDEQGLTWLQAAPKIKLLAEPRQASALSAELGGAGAAVSRAARPSGGDGAVCRQHRVSGCRDLQPAVGLGGRGSGTRHVGLHHSGHRG